MSAPVSPEMLATLPLEAVGRRLGVAVVTVEAVSGLRSAGSPRSAFRATLADGRVVKLRRLRAPERAQEIVRILEEIDHPAFARPLVRIDACLVEPWIEGRPLASGSFGREMAEEAGALLASLHARRRALSRSLHGPAPTEPYVDTMRARLADLARVGALSATRCAEVAGLAAACRAGPGLLALCHGDFSDDNLVVDPSGALRSVDNEDLGLDAVEFDVAHSLYRWAPSPVERARFLRGYATGADVGVALRSEAFWRVCAVVRSAHVRAVRLSVDASVPVREIDRLLAAGVTGAPR